MAAASDWEVRRRVRDTNYSEAVSLAARVLECDSPAQVMDQLANSNE